jgi:hypothetical protein
MGVFGESWASARALAATLAVALALLVHLHMAASTSRPGVGLLGAALFTFGGMSLGWMTVAKTYGLSTLLLFGAYALLFHPARLPATRRAFGAGLLLGLAVDARLYLIAVAPALIWGIHLRERRDRRRRAALATFGAGLALGLTPLAFFLVADPAAFFFGVVDYHRLRGGATGFDAIAPKIAVVGALFGWRSEQPGSSAQFALTALAVAASVARGGLRSPRRAPALAVVLLLGAASVTPTPIYVQYFAALAPFAIVAALLEMVGDERSEPTGHPPPKSVGGARRRAPGRSRALVVGAALYLLLAPFELRRYLAGFPGVPGPRAVEEVADWTIPTVRRVARAIETHAPEGEAILCWWPGYALEARRPLWPGTENHFGWEVVGRLTAEERRRHRLAAPEEIEAAIAERGPAVVALGHWVEGYGSPAAERIRRLLERSGYRLVETIAGIEIHRR